MTTIVEDTETGKRFLLVGSGYAGWATAMPGTLGGTFAPKYDKGETPLVLVSDEEGRLHWERSNRFRLISVDGRAPGEWLG